MKRRLFPLLVLTAGALSLVCGSPSVLAQKRYDPGASDKEIVIGHVVPYSGPASAYGVQGKAAAAYFEKVNAEGGINGRKIKFISLDDGFNPAKTVEQVRKLVEREEVLLTFFILGTAANGAVQKYLNEKQVPQLLAASPAAKFSDPKNFPWTMGFGLAYQAEAKIYVQHLLETKPNAKVAILYQNDDFGKEYLKGIEDGLGDKAKSMIVARATYEATDPTVDSQLVTLKASGADVIFDISTPKFAAQAIRKLAEIGWKPLHYLSIASSSVGAVMTPAGLDNSVGIISVQYWKDPADPQFQKDGDWQDYRAWMTRYLPGAEVKDTFYVYGYLASQVLVQILRQAGDNLTRANIMKEAANLDMTVPMMLPGIKVKTAPDDFSPIEQAQLMRFNGKSWETFGKVYGR
jgi:branched-chain amino acid transport system substrate-binding protein